MANRLYTYYPEFDENDYLLWHVFEHATQQVIQSFFFEEDAQEMMKFFESGGGFCGHTPSFILTKPPVNDINEAFSIEFA